MRPRSLSRRFLAALSSALLLQLTLLGGGTLCGMHGAHEMGTAAMMGSMHDGMQQPANASMSAASHTPTVTSTLADDCDTCDATSGCGNPWSPGSCTSMTCCTTAVAARAPSFTDVLSSAAHVRNIPEPLSAPIAPSFAPEIPPPRA